MYKFKKLMIVTSACVATCIALNVNAATDTEVEVLSRKVYELEQLVNKLNLEIASSSSSKNTLPKVNQTDFKDQFIVVKKDVDKSSDQSNLLINNDIMIKVYGNLRLDTSYDFSGTTNTIGNRTGVVALDKENPTKGALNVSVATSRIGFDISKLTDLGNLTAKLEADFWGDGTSNTDGKLRIRHAYGSIGKWLIGQTTSPFVNTDTSPDLIDFTGPMGGGTQRNVQLRFTHPIKNNQKILVALEGGDIDNFSGKSQSTGGSRLPAITFRYDSKMANDNGLIQLHGMVHENRISTNENNYKTAIGWGIGIGGKYQITDNDLIMANYYHVVGDSRYMLYTNQNNASYSSVEKYDPNGVFLGYDITSNTYDTLQLGFQKNGHLN
ncbi:DcaP family trimeric outer membrane transporter [Acinetobacter gyllenbergii]|uniref:DcaP family trimeric outer membrane transporter n=1 Tax=Acinetobacter gyllenbergii TaxID=134534 RepID=UPI0036400CE4